jgi:hypothetical protein
MKSAKDAIRRAERREMGQRLASFPGVVVAAEQGIRLVGLAADEDPELGLLGVISLRDVAHVCEEHQVARARAAGWTWAQIAEALEVTPQAVHQRHAARLALRSTPGQVSQ